MVVRHLLFVVFWLVVGPLLLFGGGIFCNAGHAFDGGGPLLPHAATPPQSEWLPALLRRPRARLSFGGTDGQGHTVTTLLHVMAVSLQVIFHKLLWAVLQVVACVDYM